MAVPAAAAGSVAGNEAVEAAGLTESEEKDPLKSEPAPTTIPAVNSKTMVSPTDGLFKLNPQHQDPPM
ncbi:hypothetical protein [Arthrobacter sp. NPDC089319]|uniref:hypothetical protein n=1 Tax=Arthrobacter sp. NPDC089319 TaxID=3155915 RepID=UPI00343FEF99